MGRIRSPGRPPPRAESSGGELTRRVDGSWVLRGSPPDASALGRRRALAGRPGDLMRPMRRFTPESDDSLIDDDYVRAGGS